MRLAKTHKSVLSVVFLFALFFKCIIKLEITANYILNDFSLSQAS